MKKSYILLTLFTLQNLTAMINCKYREDEDAYVYTLSEPKKFTFLYEEKFQEIEQNHHVIIAKLIYHNDGNKKYVVAQSQCAPVNNVPTSTLSSREIFTILEEKYFQQSSRDFITDSKE